MEGLRKQHAFPTDHGAKSGQQHTPGNSAQMTKPQPLFVCILSDSYSLSKSKCRHLFMPMDFWLVAIQNVLESSYNHSEINLES